MNVSLESIGLTSFFGLPWIVKFLWAPHIDRFGTRRSWMLGTQVLLAGVFFTTGFFAPYRGAISAVAVLLLAGAFLAATHDSAIDGYYLAALDKKDQATYVGYRVMAYRIAMMAGTGLIATIGTSIGWFPAFACAGLLLLLLYFYHKTFLPRCETGRLPLRGAFATLLHGRFLTGTLITAGSVALLYLFVNSPWYGTVTANIRFLSSVGFAGWTSIVLLLLLVLLGLFRKRISALLSRNPDSFYSQAFLSFMDRDHIGLILSFIIFLRTGEFLLSAMVAPFMVDVGIKIHYGWMQAAVGLPASIGGAMLGGFMISRFTLKKVLFPFLFLQNGSNLVYMVLAFALQKYLVLNTGNSTPVPVGTLNLASVACVQGFDQFAGGLGTSILMTFLMRICKGEYKAAHYAIGSGLMSISGLFTGVASGFIASRFGYGYFFGISFLLSAPGMILAVLVMRVYSEQKDPNTEAE